MTEAQGRPNFHQMKPNGCSRYTTTLALPNPGKGVWKEKMYVYARTERKRKKAVTAGRSHPCGCVLDVTRACQRVTTSCEGQSVSSRARTRRVSGPASLPSVLGHWGKFLNPLCLSFLTCKA